MTILHDLGALVRELLQSVPLSAVRAMFVGSLLLVLVWVLRLPRSAVIPEGGSGRWDENLKPVAAVALGIQIVIYLLL
jgi:hypothetical protein